METGNIVEKKKIGGRTVTIERSRCNEERERERDGMASRMRIESVKYRYPCECALTEYLSRCNVRAHKIPPRRTLVPVHTPDENDGIIDRVAIRANNFSLGWRLAVGDARSLFFCRGKENTAFVAKWVWDRRNVVLCYVVSLNCACDLSLRYDKFRELTSADSLPHDSE